MSLFHALTDPQFDRIIDLIQAGMSHIPAILGLIGTAFLIVKQMLNNRRTVERDAVAKSQGDLLLEHLAHMVKLPEFRVAAKHSQKLPGESPVYHMLKLPGAEYEPFPLAEGPALAEWKIEPCARGRKVRFRADGPCSMGFHWHHQTAEVLFMVEGDLVLETTDEVIHLAKGDFYRTPADMVHSAKIYQSGEVLCHWTELESDELEVGVWPNMKIP